MAGATREIRYSFKATENVTSVSERVRQALKATQQSAGAEASMRLATLAKGGGAALAIDFAGRAAETLADKLEEVRIASKTGEVGWSDYSRAFATSAPIFDRVYLGIEKNILGVKGLTAQLNDAKKSQELSDSIRGLLSGEASKNAIVGKTGADLAKVQLQDEISSRVKALEEFRTQHKVDLNSTQNSALDKAILAAKKEQTQRLLKIDMDEYEARAKVVDDGEHKIADLRASNRASELRILGQDLAAQTIEIKAAQNQQIYQIIQSYRALLKDENDPAQRDRIVRQRGQESAAVQQAAALKLQAAIEADRASKEQRRIDVVNLGVSFLEKELELKRDINGQDLERLKIQEDFTKRRSQLVEALRKENLSDSERGLLRQVLGGLDEQQKAAIGKVGQLNPVFSGGLAASVTGNHLSGLAAASRESDPVYQIASNSKLNADLMARAVKLLESIDKKSNAGGGVDIAP